MKIKLEKGTFETCLIFVLSPFLSIPFIFVQLKRGNEKLMTFLLSIMIGLLSFLFVPISGFDKTAYIKRYLLFKEYNFAQLKDYFIFGLKPDYIFDTIIYLFAKSNISFHFLFFFLTTLTVYSVFRFVQKTNEKLLSQRFKYNILFALFVLFSFSLPGLFSGIRFILAGSAFIWAVYYLFIDKVRLKGILFFAIAILTHFSFAFFIPPVLLLFFYPKVLSSKIILLSSLAFLLIPKELLGDLFSYFELSESYANKTEAYLTSEREVSANAQILTYLRSLWVYFSYLFILVLNKDKNNKLYLIFVVLLSFINITYSIPIVFNRYLIVPQFLLVAYLIYSKLNGSIKNIYFYLYFTFMMISTAIDLYVLRPSIFASYQLIDMLTIVQVLSNKFTIYDILQ
jgi:hypothetical protein